MIGEGKDNVASLSSPRRLSQAVRAAKIAAAHRSDVVVDIREADRARLEILAEEMQSIVEDVPASDDFFDFALSGGPQPRYWVDGTAHVTMARDRRTYRFCRETRLGRVVLAESTDPRAVADRIVDYVAERILEREKAYAEIDMPRSSAARVQPVSTAPSAANKLTDFFAGLPRPRLTDAAFAASWLMIGIVVGAGLLLAIASMRGFTLN